MTDAATNDANETGETPDAPMAARRAAREAEPEAAPMTMAAVVIDEIAAAPRVGQVETPRPGPDDVLVEVRATGLCRSDWHAWAGHDDITLPHVPGHEFAGVVREVGARVTRWAVGDRVTMPFVEGCGRCEWCAAGDAQVCPNQEQPGFTHWGSFAQFVLARQADTNLVALDDSITFEAAAALGCRFATAYRALTGRARVRAGESVVVIGAGGVGLSCVMIAASLGCDVIAVDRSSAALELARQHGARWCIQTGEEVDVPAAVRAVVASGAHVAIDAVGAQVTCHDALHSLRRRGRHVQVGLMPPVQGHPRVPMDRVIAYELDVLGSHGMSAAHYPRMMAAIAAGDLAPQALVARTVNLSEAAERLPTFDRSPDAGVTIIDPWA